MSETQLSLGIEQPDAIIPLPQRIMNMYAAYGVNENHTCSECVHLLHLGYRGHAYLKCDVNHISYGEGTDWRAKWVACGKWEGQA